MTRALRGDDDAFVALMRRYQGSVYAIALSRLLNAADAEEVAQDVFLRAYEHLGQLRTPDRFAAWVSRITLSCVHSRGRRQWRETVADVEHMMRDAADPVIQQELSDRREDMWALLTRALDSLPESHRTPFLMRYLADASYRVIGEALLIAPRAAERRVARARSALRRYFESRGIADVARDVLLPSLLVAPETPISQIVGEQLLDLPGPSASHTARYAPSPLLQIATCALIATGLLVGFGSVKHLASGRETARRDAPGATLMSLSAPGRAGPAEGMAPRLDAPSAIPAGAVVILDDSFDGLTPGVPLPGWTRGVYAQADEIPPGGGSSAAMVNTNIPSAYYQFPVAQGVVTIEMWVRPAAGESANWGIAVGEGDTGWSPGTEPGTHDAADRATLVNKDEHDLWCYGADGPVGSVPFARYDGRWHRLRVRYNTVSNEYDLHLDDRLVRRGIPSPRRFSDGVSFVALNSGRWFREEDKRSYFDDIRIYVEPHGKG